MSEHYFKLEIELPLFLAGSSLLSQKGYGKGGGGNPKVSKGRKNEIAQAENKLPGAGAAGILSKSTVEELLLSAICCGLAEPVCINFHAVGDYKCSAVQALPKTTKSTLVPIFQSLSLFSGFILIPFAAGQYMDLTLPG